MECLAFFSDHLQDFLDDVRGLVEIESPTYDVAGAERAADYLADRLGPLGTLESEMLEGFGPMLQLRRPGTETTVLLMAHFDTVWPVGSWPELWSVRDGKIFGPGVFDMKAGLVFILWLLRYLAASGRPHPTLEVTLNPDEEVGSLGSKHRIAQSLSRADFALVLEPANLDGSLKVARKGSGEYMVEIRGRSAHQGAEPELGVNAVVEAAHQVLRMAALEDLEAGTTVGPNVISGGTATNTVPDRAEIQVDVRAWNSEEQRRLDEGLRRLEPVLSGSELRVDGRWNRPPMESSPASLELFERARGIGAELGLEIAGVRWGGSSDANLAAEAGVPTVDGFGPIGEGAHQEIENIVVEALPKRLALFTELVCSLAIPPEEWLSKQAMAQLHARRSTAAS
jgi:glutamate carboxypeptidase